MIRTALTVAAFSIAIASPASFAGELAPPAGPVSPTMKDLEDVEPRVPIRNDFDTLTPIVISQPGSYYLAEDILGFPNQHGIEITSGDVTLDMRGFRILGNTEVGSDDGIHITIGLRNVSIFGGSIIAFFGDGIEGFGTFNTRVNDVYCAFNGSAGISTGEGSVIRGCVTANNGSTGIVSNDSSTVVECSSVGNGGIGIVTSTGSTVASCAAYLNDSDGFAGSGSFLNCASYENGKGGGQGSGFRVSNGSVIMGCSSRAHTNHGIELSIGIGGCLVLSNQCRDNAGAGVFVGLNDNRIEANNVIGNNIGIDVNSSQNLIISNSARDNTTSDFDINVNNARGQVLIVTNSVITSGNPWANLVY